MSAEKIGVVGLGNMGRPMSACLVRAGFNVAGFDVADAARAEAGKLGLEVAPDAANAVAGARAVITLLPNGKNVRAALDALRPHLGPRCRCSVAMLRTDQNRVAVPRLNPLPRPKRVRILGQSVW